MALMLGIYTRPGGDLILDATPFLAGDVVMARNERGDETLTAPLELTELEALRLYTQSPQVPTVILSAGPQYLWTGVLEEPRLRSDAAGSGVTISAYGYQRALNDTQYTALWSTTDMTAWRPVTREEVARAEPSRYILETGKQGRLYLALKKNAVYGNSPLLVGMLALVPPDGGSRPLVGVSFAYKILLPSGWTFRWGRWTDNFGTFTLLGTIAGSGSLISGALVWGHTADAIETVEIYRDAPNATNTSEDGDWYVSLTEVRVVSSVANQVYVSTTAARTNGSNVTVAVNSTARMYAGQRLTISGTNSEIITVASVTNATSFVAASIANAPVGGYPSGTIIQAFFVDASEVASDLVTAVSALNPSRLSSSTALVQTTGRDLLEYVAVDAYPNDILTQLARDGDAQGRMWLWRVRTGQLLEFAPRGTGARTWYVYPTSLEIERLMEAFANSAYGVYTDGTGRRRVTAVATDTQSVGRYGYIRRRAVDADTSNAALAAVERDAYLADRRDPFPRTAVPFAAVYDALGGEWPLTAVQAGDIIIAQNLPWSLRSRIGQIRATAVEVNVTQGTIAVEPEFLRPEPQMRGERV